MSVTLEAVTFDCADALALGQFWSAVLEHPIDAGATSDFAAIGLADGSELAPAWMFIKVPEPKPAKNRVHPDLSSTDQPAEVDRVIELGATRLGDFDEGGTRWTTLADPEGNEFDIAAS
jgi:hypothetical protein